MNWQLTIQDRRDNRVWSVPFRGDCLRVGKSPDNDVVLDSPKVSRAHCEVRIHPGD
ncbi:MAG: FHA domain-containing protein [Planctomycetes bacterium]|nr:FHA domain-containing protein [Planctomycetota bacterium]